MRLASLALAMLLLGSTAQNVSAAPAVRVFPSGATVPQRLLRISLVFGSSQDESIAKNVRLIAQDGSDISAPFADPPLWSADRKTLTLLLDPSRQKLGLAAHRAYGFVLQSHRRAQLMLGSRTIKTWYVTSGSCPALDPARWIVRRVGAGSRKPLVVHFSGAIDVLSQDYVAIASPQGTRVAGSTQLDNAERTWSFLPAVAWRRGDALAVHPRFEDPCGNEVGEPFEHAPGTGLGSDRRTTFIPLPMY